MDHTHALGTEGYIGGDTGEKGSHSHRFYVYTGGQRPIVNTYGRSVLSSNGADVSQKDYVWNPNHIGEMPNYIEGVGDHKHSWGGNFCSIHSIKMGNSQIMMANTIDIIQVLLGIVLLSRFRHLTRRLTAGSV